jgi:hypothetical protein
VENTFECVCVKLTLNGVNIYIASVYRSPDSSNLLEFLEYLEEFLIKVNNKLKGKHIFVLGGDFNINLLQNAKEVGWYINVIPSFNLKVLNNQATRVTCHSSTIIDHLILIRI